MSPILRKTLSGIPRSYAEFMFGIARLLTVPLFVTTAQAATWYWDSNGTGTGVSQASGAWNTTNSNWWDGGGNVVWNNLAGNIAHFGTSAGVGPASVSSRTVTISGMVNASGLIFNRSDSTYGYTLTGGTVALANGSSIEVVGRLNTEIERRHRIDSVISGADINITRSSLTTTNLAMLRLGGNNTWTGTLTLSSGAAAGLFVEAMSGASLNNLDTIAVGIDTSLILATAEEFTKNFSITGTGAGSRGAIRFDVDGGKISGGVTLTGDATIAAATGITGTVSGNISESGGARALTISAGSIVLSGANTHSGGTTLTGGTLHINSATALGTGTFTISGGAINNTSGGSIAVANNAQTWNGNFTFAGANDLDLGTGNVSLGAGAGTARTITVSANTLTVGGVISDGATAIGLTKAGAGTLVLSGANTYTGVTAVNAGTLVFTGGSTGGGNVTVANGATLNIRGNYTIGTASTNVTLSGATGSSKGTLSLADNAVNTVNIASLTVGGTGTSSSFLNFDLGNAGISDKIVTDTFTVNAGGAILNFSQITGTEIGAGTYSLIGFTTPTGTSGLSIGAVPNAPAGKVASLSLSSTSTETRLNVVLASASTTNSAYWTGAASSQWNTVSGATTNFVENANGSGATDILPDATTDVYFTANSSANPSTTLGQDFSVRSLHFTGAGTPAASAHTIGGSSLLTIGSGGLTVDAGSANHSIDARVHLGTSQTWALAGTSGQTFTVSGAISGSNLTVSGGRALVLTGANTYGDTIIGSGSTVRIGDGGATGTLGAGAVTNSGTLAFNRTGTFTIANTIGGTGELVVSAAGTVTLSGANTYTGPTSVNGGGTLSVTSLNNVTGGTASSNLGAPTTVANGTVSLGSLTTAGTLRYTGTGETTDRVINLAGTTGGGSITQNGTTGLLKFTSDITTTGIGNKTLTLRGTGEGEFAGIIASTGANTGTTNLTKNDAGIWTLSGANTYTGTTTVSGGILRLTGGGKLGTGNLAMSGATGQLDLNGTNQTVAGLSGVVGANILNNGAATTSTLTIGNGAGTGTYSGVLSNGTGTLALTKIGTGAITLAGTAANTYTGLTTVSAGVLTLNKTDVNAIVGNILIDGGYLRYNTTEPAAHNQIADTAAVTVTAGGFNTGTTGAVNNGANGLNETIGSLTVSGSGVYNQNTLTNFIVAGAASFSGGNGAIFFSASGASFSSGSLTVADMSRTTGGSSASNANSLNGFIVYGNHATVQSVVRVGAGGLTLTANTNSGNNIVLRSGTSGSKLSLDGDVSTTGAYASAIIRDAATSGAAETSVELSATGTGPVTRTFNVGGGGADLTIGANVGLTNGGFSTASLNKTGLGTLTLNGTNTYTGATTVNAGKLQVAGGGINSSTQISVTGSTLELLSSNVIGNSAGLALNNATLIARGATETLGTLTITGNNQLDLVTVGNAIFFEDSSDSEWSSALAILNWNGKTAGGINGVDNRVVFGTDDQGLLSSQVSKISFVNPTIDGIAQTGTFGALILPTGEVVAVIPEASSALLVLFGSAAVLGRRRRSWA